MPVPRSTTPDPVTHVVFVLDETGSMQSMAVEAQQSFNSYVDTLKEDREHEYRFSLLRFDTLGLWQQYDNVRIDQVQRMDDYHPGAGTPLYDAVAHALKAQEKHLKANQAAKVIVAIVTDGQENSSKEWTAATLNSLIKAKEAHGWTFVYLAVGAEAWKKEADFGAGTTVVMNNRYTSGARGMSVGTQGLGATTVMYAAQATAGVPWVDPNNEFAADAAAAASDTPVVAPKRAKVKVATR